MTFSTSFIYALADPITKKIRYVGYSYRPTYRLYQHLKFGCGHVHNWLISLESLGLSPIQIILDVVSSETAPIYEMIWISRLKRVGHPLTNLTVGGDGISGFHHSEETKEKIASANQPLAKARCNTPEGREEMRRRALLNTHPRREFLLAQTKTEKYRKALSVARKKQPREKMVAMSKKGWADPNVATARLVGLAASRHCPIRIARLTTSLQDPEVQRRRIETRRRNGWLCLHRKLKS